LALADAPAEQSRINTPGIASWGRHGQAATQGFTAVFGLFSAPRRQTGSEVLRRAMGAGADIEMMARAVLAKWAPRRAAYAAARAASAAAS
jgi:hypothetical protein